MALFPTRLDGTGSCCGGVTTTCTDDMHPGQLEVSIMLDAYPGTGGNGYRDTDGYAGPPGPDLHVTGIRGYAQTGVIGRPCWT
jgi:hypothetical protein